MHYSPVRHWCCHPFDLHVLGTPPAFVLSQDQTLKLNFCARASSGFPSVGSSVFLL
jgi:hypothetical protein